MHRILTKRERIILIATAAVIVFSLGFNFAAAPVLKVNDSLNKEIRLTRAKLKKYLALLGQKDYIQAKFGSPAAGAPSDKDDTFVNALSELEGLAKEAGLRIVDIRPQNASRDSSSREAAAIDLRTEGAMESYVKFIYNAENSILLLKIKRVQLSAKSSGQDLEGSFSISQISDEAL